MKYWESRLSAILRIISELARIKVASKHVLNIIVLRSMVTRLFQQKMLIAITLPSGPIHTFEKSNHQLSGRDRHYQFKQRSERPS